MTKQYDSYKPSGVEWVGDIPSHWSLNRACSVFNKKKDAYDPKEETVTVFRKGLVTKRSNVRSDGFTESTKEHGYQKISKGDFAIHEMDAFAGAMGISDSDGKCSPIIMVLEHMFHNDNRYSSYFFKALSNKGYINFFAKGIRERTVDFRYKNFKQILFPMVSSNEAFAIANYLDNKTTAIDGSIETLKVQKKTLIEQKKSIIHKAVTQGLDSSVPMKDSGVEWIGMVPEHWDLKKWKNILTILNGFAFKSTDHDESENGMPIVKMSNLKNGSLFLDTAQKVKFKKEYSPYILKDGDLLLGMSGSIENFAFVKESDGLCALNQRVCSIKSIKTTNKYIQYFIQGSSYRQKIRVNALGTAIMNLSSDDLRNMEIAISDISEQQQIVDYLDRKTSKIDESVAEVDKQIGLLEEYKKTLINDVVTGKKRVYEGEI